MKTTVIVTASIGAGHNQVAYALKESLLDLNPDHKVQIVDLLLEQRIYQMVNLIYLETVQKAPGVFSKAYCWTQNHQTNSKVTFLLNHLCYRSLRQLQQIYQPDAFLFTHPFPVAAYRPRGLSPAYAILTDFGYHSFWLNHHLSGYYVCQPGQFQSLVSHGIHANRILLSGIPLRRNFNSKTHLSGGYPASLRNRQVLLMGGGLGIGSIAAFVEKLISFHHEIRFVVVTGRNESLRQHLISKTSHLPNWQIIGYTDQIAELMRESSLLVTKAGAVTLAEAASSGLPTIILNPLPGHEEENTEIATMQGWALKADSIEAGQAILSQLLQNTSQLMNMRKQAFHYASPNAAFIVTNHLQDKATQERSQLTC